MSVRAASIGPGKRRGIVFNQQYVLWLILLALCVVLAFLNPRFVRLSNIINILRQASINLILSVGMTCVILTGCIDLSVGSVLALCGCLTGIVMMETNMALGIAAGLLTGIAVGIVNGLLVSKMRIPPFITTLGTMTIARGLALVSTGGQFISGLPRNYIYIGDGLLFGKLPIPVLIAAIIVIIIHIMLSRTKLGLQIYGVGGNYEASRLSGVNNHKVIITVYALSGFFAAIAGIILTARVASAQPTFGEGYNLNAVASVIIGGTSIRGGEGNVLRTAMGALIIAVLSNGLNILNVDYFWQQVVIGSVIIIAVILDKFR